MSKLSVFYLMMSLLWLSLPSSAQTPLNELDEVGRIVYIQRLSSGEESIVSLVNGQTRSFTLNSGECYRLSTDLSQILISQTQNPTSIRVYILNDETRLYEIPWRRDWQAPCNFAFSGTENELLLVGLQSDRTDYVTLDLKTGLQMGGINQRVISPPFDESTLPGLLIANPMYRFLPNTSLVIYQRCLHKDSDITTLTYCSGEDQWVLYDTATRTDIEIFQTPDFNIARREGLLDFTFNRFVVSPSTQYITYPSPRGRMIYDRFNDRYLDASAVETLNTTYYRTEPAQWSPNEHKFAFVVYPVQTGPEIEIDNAVFVVFDLATNTVQLLAGEYGFIEYHWFPESDAIAVHTKAYELYRLGLDGTQTLIAENVERVFTYYPPPQ
ncbi:MAG: hypothetical protein MUF87_17385 [Anaerolineae bacterium]|jgi:hypothetical protein|nr:hypothetical protein [Anaerolineae bacterium]